MPVNIISQEDLKHLSLRGDKREATDAYKTRYYPSGIRRPQDLSGKQTLAHTEKRQTAPDIAVRDLKIPSKNIKDYESNDFGPRNERYKRSNAPSREINRLTDEKDLSRKM